MAVTESQSLIPEATTITPPTTTTTNNTTTTASAVAATVTATINGATPTPTKPNRDPPKNNRGLNKPKCSKCGHVARSRCPFQSCKSCCAKAENPCHIHVLKSNASFPEKTKSPSPPLFDQQSADATSTGASLRVNSFRQLSQFKGAQVPPRPKRPMTKKDAAALNQWRFSKFKEYKESNIEAENEAFDRYMQNVNLLEEAFIVNSSLEYPPEDGKDDDSGKILSAIKAKLRSNPSRTDTLRKRIQEIVDKGLNKLQKREFSDDEVKADFSDLSGSKKHKRLQTEILLRSEKISAVNELIDKLNKARNEEDLQSCLFNRYINVARTSKDWDSSYLCSTLFTKVELNQEDLNNIDVHFATLDQIEDL